MRVDEKRRLVNPSLRIKIFNPFQIFSLACWLGYILYFHHYPDFMKNGFMSLTMVFGSLIAGATSEGGGAVAFPVMTLVFKISPQVARDFSILIQSFGMMSALFVIVKNKIPYACRILKFGIFGGFLGQLIAVVSQISFEPTMIKMIFVSLWLGFALVLYLVKKRENNQVDINHKNISAMFIILISLLGGFFTFMTGSGVDIFTFSLSVLFFRVSEKIATPTSVMLMAIQSVVAVFLSLSFGRGISAQAINYWLVCLPVVILGAPLGALFIVKKSREFIIYLLQASLITQFLVACFILDLSIFQLSLSLFVLFGALLFFSLLFFLGRSKS